MKNLECAKMGERGEKPHSFNGGEVRFISLTSQQLIQHGNMVRMRERECKKEWCGGSLSRKAFCIVYWNQFGHLTGKLQMVFASLSNTHSF